MKNRYENELLQKEIDKIISTAEMSIKKTIQKNALGNLNDRVLLVAIKNKIDKAIKLLPKETPNITEIKKQLTNSSFLWLNFYKNQITKSFFLLPFIIRSNKTPLETYKMIIGRKTTQIEQTPIYESEKSMWDYVKEVNRRSQQLALMPVKDILKKRSMSIEAQVEIEVRREKNEKDIKKFIDKGETIKRLSSHKDCSKRCETWQGKLVDLEKPAIDNSNWTGDYYKGEKIYSLEAITNKLDKYGYKNNILVGFNCRHFLIDINAKEEELSKAEIIKGRKLNSTQRNLEREIRSKSKVSYLELDKKRQQKLNEDILEQRKFYLAFCKKNNIKPLTWRLQISWEDVKV